MIHVTKPYLPDQEKYIAYVTRIFESGRLTNHGDLVLELERRLEEFLGVEHLILVSNGTLALQIAYKLLDLQGEVITTPFSFVATTSSLQWEHLRPVFADIDSATFNLDPAEAEKKITPETSAILPVHVFGNACDVHAFERIARDHRLKVIYDAAHAFDVKVGGESVLRFGDVSTLSFHATKVFHTIEGGALIVRDKQLYERARKMIDFGIDGPDKIRFLGINGKMNEFQAAMGLCVLDDMERVFANRKAVYERYEEAFRNRQGLRLQQRNAESTPNYSYFPVVFDSEEVLLRVREALNRAEIFPRRYFYPSLDTLDYVESEPMLRSHQLSQQILCLPIYESLAANDQEQVISIIQEELQ